MRAKPIRLACVAAVALLGASFVRAQEAGKGKDAALDSLLEELKKDDPGDAGAPKKAAKKAEPARAKSASDKAGTGQKSKDGAGLSSGTGKPGSAAPGGGAPAGKARKANPIAPKDQALDDLLGKLGESKDEPAAKERPGGQGPGAGEVPKGAGGGEKERAKLGGKDKEIDDRLEQLAGRKREAAECRRRREERGGGGDDQGRCARWRSGWRSPIRAKPRRPSRSRSSSALKR